MALDCRLHLGCRIRIPGSRKIPESDLGPKLSKFGIANPALLRRPHSLAHRITILSAHYDHKPSPSAVSSGRTVRSVGAVAAESPAASRVLHQRISSASQLNLRRFRSTDAVLVREPFGVQFMRSYHSWMSLHASITVPPNVSYTKCLH